MVYNVALVDRNKLDIPGDVKTTMGIAVLVANGCRVGSDYCEAVEMENTEPNHRPH